MNRDFEQEYKELAKTEVPDLWNRIEAGLAEKSTPESRPKSVVIPFVKRYAALVAALLCAVIVIPVFGIMKQAVGGGKSGSAAMEKSADMEAPTAEATEEQEAGAMEMSAEAEAAEADIYAEAEAPAAETKGEEVADIMQDDFSNKVMEKQEELKNSTEEARDMAEDGIRDSEASKKQVLTHVIVEVTAAEDYMYGETIEEMGTLYTAIVQEEPEGTLAEGEEIAIFIPAFSSYGLVKGDLCELNLAYYEGEEDFFTLAGYQGQTD